MTNVIFLLDSISNITYDTFDLLDNNAELIRDGIDIQELDRFKDIKQLIVINDYLDKHSEDRDKLSLIKDIYDVDIIHISKDKNTNYFKEAKRVYADIKVLTLNGLHEIIVNNEVDKDKFINSSNLEAFSEGLVKVADKLIKVDSVDIYMQHRSRLKYILLEYLQFKYKNDSLSLNNAYLQKTIEEQGKELEEKFDRIEMIETIKESYVNAYTSLMKDYKALQSIYTSDVSDNNINLSGYPNAPNVIKFDLLTDLDNIFEYLKVLSKDLKFSYKTSNKVLVLADSSYKNKVKLVPSYFYIVAGEVENNNIYKEDYIFKFGEYHDTIDLLLTNKLNLDTLIILDTRVNKLDLQGKYISMDVVSNVSDIDTLGLTPATTLARNNKICNWDTTGVSEYIEEVRYNILARATGITEVIATLEVLKRRIADGSTE